MSALRLLLILLLSGLLAATPVAAVVALPGGPDVEVGEEEVLAPARAAAPRTALAAPPPVAQPSSDPRHPAPARPAAPAAAPVRTHVLHCVWRE